MTRRLTQEDFVSRSISIHGNKYNYDGVVYINSKTKVSILCNNCQNTFQQTPESHLIGQGCPNCVKNKKLTLKDFINKSMLIHKDKYNYNGVNYVNSKTKVDIYCNICNNLFSQIPNDHLSGNGCLNCSGTKKLSINEFINKSNIVHRNRYNYDNSVYICSNIKIKIYCNSCKSFFYQIPNAHLNGQGCPCNNIGRYTRKYFEKYPEKKNIPGDLYFKKFINIITNEVFYKIGITVGKRYFGKDYEITTIKELPMTLYEAFLQEQELLNKFKYLQYIPQISFDGWNECFTKELIEQEEIKDLFNL